MKTRLLLTNGPATRELLWVEHTGKDVYWGDPGQVLKGSYHGSGDQHLVGQKRYLSMAKGTPLPAIKGLMPLTTLIVGVDPAALDPSVAPPYRGRRADNVLVLDYRTFRTRRHAQCLVSLLESDRWDVLHNLRRSIEAPGSGGRIHHILIAPPQTPWLVLVVFSLATRQNAV